MSQSAPTAIVGLGYVGLPLAQAAVRAGVRIVGFDINQRTVDQLNAGISPISDIDDAGIQEMLTLGFSPTSDATALDACDTYVICVPTPLSDEQGPDLTAVMSATRSLVPHIKTGDLVILESTTYPGTTEEVVAPILAESGLSIPDQVKLAFSPERVDPGNPVYGITNTPKVVGGLNAESGEAAREFYARFCDTVVMARGAKEAELAKLLENTYRHVNIALVNELAVLSHELDIDLWDSIRCAATKPFGFQAFYPGPGVGGHCIPIDPNYLSHHVRSRLGQTFRFVELAQDVNSAMPAYVCRRLQDLLNDSGLALRGARIAVLGVTYKPNIADSRESPSAPIGKNLLRMGAQLKYWDPFVPQWSVDGTAIERVEELSAVVDPAQFDAVLLLQQHKELDLELIARSEVPVFDTRNVLAATGAVERL